ncbi:lanthionine synthetase LanC family protein [Kaistella sp.]|uniref:lanthionine synthetase LanC family protein n=1 Tax=Kaistella sp. TaxID=2782235 RepID=UPI003C4B5053
MNTLKKIHEIESYIKETWNKEPYVSDLSLFTGVSGVPIFYYMLYQYTNESKYLDKIEIILNLIFERLNESDENIPKTYCLGLAGIGYMLNFLEESDELKNIDFTEALEVIDEILLDTIDYFLSYIDHIDSKDKMEHIDFLHGVSGIAHYFLERNKKEIFSGKITILFEKLSEIVKWDYEKALESINNTEINQNSHKINIGLAHGHISFILLFSKFLSLVPDNQIVREGIKTSVKTVLLFRNDDENSFCQFPSIAVNKHTANYNIHLGWCYGDQSVSYGLYKAGKILNDINLIALSEEIALSTIKRKSLQLALLNEENCDAGFCHGTISVAYYHKKWYSITSNVEFLKLYKKFTNDTLLIANKGNGLAGYKKKTATGEYQNTLGLLDGIAGIGVFLIDSLLNENISIKWESIFLID